MSEYILKLSKQDVNMIIEGLGHLPLKLSIDTFQKVYAQVSQQDTSQTTTSDNICTSASK